MQKNEETEKKPDAAKKPIAGELTLSEMRVVLGAGGYTPITNGRYNPPNQKTRFGNPV